MDLRYVAQNPRESALRSGYVVRHDPDGSRIGRLLVGGNRSREYRTAEGMSFELLYSCTEDVTFDSEGAEMSGWFYSPDSPPPRPPVVMTHGLSATKQMVTDRDAEVFTEAGLAVLLYDYREFGESGGSRVSESTSGSQPGSPGTLSRLRPRSTMSTRFGLRCGEIVSAVVLRWSWPLSTTESRRCSSGFRHSDRDRPRTVRTGRTANR